MNYEHMAHVSIDTLSQNNLDMVGNVSDNVDTVENVHNQSKYDSLNFNLHNKGLNIGHLNIQGICGQNLTKFEEIKCMLTSDANKNLHIFGMSETKLKDNKLSDTFKIDGYQMPFRKDNASNGGGGIIVYVKTGINAKRR
ncbi:MAG: hypothetical protein ABW185_22250, partial [Sedimenticola sp.]